jgi:hypothetical protein
MCNDGLYWRCRNFVLRKSRVMIGCTLRISESKQTFYRRRSYWSISFSFSRDKNISLVGIAGNTYREVVTYNENDRKIVSRN